MTGSGWDWGPVLITSGIWKEVRLETYQAKLEDVRIDYELDQDLKKAGGVITSNVEGGEGCTVSIRGQLDGKNVFKVDAPVDDHGIARARFSIDSAALWWPHGYGEQPLYSIQTTLLSADGTDIDLHTQRLGIRKAELVQKLDDIGKTFFFRINDTDIFCGGSDWIPADSFLPRITTERYRSWLQTMVDGNQVMIRVWGGGIYEADVFYDACDELGILVWQDFMFGCGNYPAWKEMRESIRLEATQNVKRLQKHTSIVLYAGNNEDYQVQEQFGLTYNYADKDPESWLKTDFPARYIYEKVSFKCHASRNFSCRFGTHGFLSRYYRRLSRRRVQAWLTILGRHGEMACPHPIGPLETCINGTCGMEAKKSIKSSIRSVVDSTANSEWRHFLTSTPSSTMSRTTRSCIPSHTCSISTTRQTDTSAGLRRIWSKTFGQLRTSRYVSILLTFWNRG